MEVFKEILGYPDYLISNKGRLKTKSRKVRFVHAVTGNTHYRLTKEKFLKVYNNNRTGYKFVQLYSSKKSTNKTIHRLVALHFLPYESDPHKNIVNHKDGNKHNNTVENLEWCTNAYNHHHATVTGLIAKGSEVGNSKLNEKTVHAIKWFLNKGYTHTELSKAFNISRPTITLIANNKSWKHVKLTGEELTINKL